MSTDKVQNDWAELKGKIKSKWSKFGDTELESFKGNLDTLTDKIQKAYGYTKDKAEQEYKDFKKTLEPSVAVETKAKPS